MWDMFSRKAYRAQDAGRAVGDAYSVAGRPKKLCVSRCLLSLRLGLRYPVERCAELPPPDPCRCGRKADAACSLVPYTENSRWNRNRWRSIIFRGILIRRSLLLSRSPLLVSLPPFNT